MKYKYILITLGVLSLFGIREKAYALTLPQGYYIDYKSWGTLTNGYNTGFGLATSSTQKISASFTPNQSIFNGFGFGRMPNGGTGATSSIIVSIVKDSQNLNHNTSPVPSIPSTTTIIMSKTYTPAEWNALSTSDWTIVTSSNPIAVTKDDYYWIVFELANQNLGSNTNYPQINATLFNQQDTTFRNYTTSGWTAYNGSYAKASVNLGATFIILSNHINPVDNPTTTSNTTSSTELTDEFNSYLSYLLDLFIIIAIMELILWVYR